MGEGFFFFNIVPMLPSKWQLRSDNSFLENSRADASMYVEGRIPKYKKVKGRKIKVGSRKIHAPIPELSQLQRDLIKRLATYRLGKHPASFAYRPGRSIVDMAKLHTGNRRVLRLDLEDFFGHVTFAALRASLPKNVPKDLVNLIERWCFLDGSLPQGAPSSPYLSNVAMFRVDQAMTTLARTWRHVSSLAAFDSDKIKLDASNYRAVPIVYSRYCDDLQFSSNYRQLNGIIPKVREILAPEFKLNAKKIHSAKSSQRQAVLGIVVNDGVSNLRLSRKALRAEFHNMILDRASGKCRPYHRLIDGNEVVIARDATGRMSQYHGRVNFIEQVSSEQAKPFHKQLRILTEVHSLEPSDWSNETLDYLNV